MVSTRQLIGDRKPALVIIDNFKGQVTAAVNALLEEHDIHVCLLPPNTTDRLQPLNISVNKAAKDFLKGKFQEWYSDRIMEQLDGQDIEASDIQPIDLRMTVLKEVGAKWLVEMVEHFERNPQIIVNRFIQSGITAALDGCQVENESEEDNETESEDLESEEESENSDFVEDLEMSDRYFISFDSHSVPVSIVSCLSFTGSISPTAADQICR